MKQLILFLSLLAFIISFQAKGVDISEHQGNINFRELKNGGYSFVIIRAGYGRESSQQDRKFNKFYNEAKEAGLNVGAYWYSYADSANDAFTEAKVFHNIIKGKKFEYPIYYDIEENKIFQGGYTNKIAKNFCGYFENNHYFCGLYASLSYLNNYFSSEVKEKYSIWVAQYNSQCDYHGNKGMWQYSSRGGVPGYGYDIDKDIAYVDFRSIIVNGHFNGF